MKWVYYAEVVLDHTIRFEVPGKPMAMPRARHARVGAFVRTYTPEEAVSHKGLVALAFQRACKDQNFTPPMDAPVSLLIHVVRTLPASAPKWQRADAKEPTPWGQDLPVTTKPDWDNYGKLVSDALNGLAYRDDGQVFEGIVRKGYGICNKTVVSVSYHHVEKRKA